MNDLTKRLREHFETSNGDAHATCGEAADEIERLRAARHKAIEIYGQKFDSPWERARQMYLALRLTDEQREME